MSSGDASGSVAAAPLPGQASPAPRRRRSLAAGSLAELVLPPLPAGTLLARPLVAQHLQAQQQQQAELAGMEAPRVEIKTSMGTFQVEARRSLHSFYLVEPHSSLS